MAQVNDLCSSTATCRAKTDFWSMIYYILMEVVGDNNVINVFLMGVAKN